MKTRRVRAFALGVLVIVALAVCVFSLVRGDEAVIDDSHIVAAVATSLTDGGAVVAGWAGDEEVVLLRYGADGRPDGRFGRRGVVRSRFGLLNHVQVLGVRVVNGRIRMVVAVKGPAHGDGKTVVADYRLDGTLAATLEFESLIPTGGRECGVTDAESQGDKVIVLVRVWSRKGGMCVDGALARLDGRGVDRTFAGDGLAELGPWPRTSPLAPTARSTSPATRTTARSSNG